MSRAEITRMRVPSPRIVNVTWRRRPSSVAPKASLTFHPMSEQLSGLATRERIVAMLSGFFGVLALLLAVEARQVAL